MVTVMDAPGAQPEKTPNLDRQSSTSLSLWAQEAVGASFSESTLLNPFILFYLHLLPGLATIWHTCSAWQVQGLHKVSNKRGS